MTSARTALMRLLEKSQRWDELANVLEQEATIESDVETKVLLETKLAKLRRTSAGDLTAAGEAWARIARLVDGRRPRDPHTASRLFEKGERNDLAAQGSSPRAPSASKIRSRAASSCSASPSCASRSADGILAGDSYAEAADALRNGKLWKEADRLYSAAEAWEKAANAAYQRGLLTGDFNTKPRSSRAAADYLVRANRGRRGSSSASRRPRTRPLNDDYSNLLVARYN